MAATDLSPGIMQSLFKKDYIRFIFVGILNTVFGYGIFAVLVLLSVDHRIALAVASVLGVIFNYYTTGSLVFKGRGVKAFVKYVVVYLLAYTTNVFLLEAIIAFGVSKLIAQGLALPCVVMMTFFLCKYWVFRRHEHKVDLKEPKKLA